MGAKSGGASTLGEYVVMPHFSTLSDFVNRFLRFGRGPNRKARIRQRCRVTLETLEVRTVPSTVMNLNDSGTGSLRDAIANTAAGGTVDFQPGLTGTIILTSGELDIAEDLTITGPGAGVITVSGNNASRVFDIAAENTVTISGLTVADGMSNNVAATPVTRAGAASAMPAC
jgi:hypothetical protein